MIPMRRHSGQKGGETVKPVEFCKNRRVLQEPLSSGCEKRTLSDKKCKLDIPRIEPGILQA